MPMQHLSVNSFLGAPSASAGVVETAFNFDDLSRSAAVSSAPSSPPQSLLVHSLHSPKTSLINYNPFTSYNTFKLDHSLGGDTQDEESLRSVSTRVSFRSAKKAKSVTHKSKLWSVDGVYDPYYDEDEDLYQTEGRELHVMYSWIGGAYRSFCFSANGIKFSMLLNIIMVLINTFLIIYEVILMVNSDSFSLYYNMALPLFCSVFDVLLTVILMLEIGLHLVAIYKCRVCDYFQYNNDHKIDVLVFLLSLFLCILYVMDAFGMSDMDSIGLLMLRIVRDVMRFARCIIFAKLLYDSYVQLQRPSKDKQRRVSVSSTPCSSGWSGLKMDQQQKFVCL